MKDIKEIIKEANLKFVCDISDSDNFHEVYAYFTEGKRIQIAFKKYKGKEQEVSIHWVPLNLDISELTNKLKAIEPQQKIQISKLIEITEIV